MTNWSKKTLIAACTAALAAGALAGCGSSSGESGSPDGANGAASGEPLEITMLATLYGPNPPSGPLQKLLEEATNTKLNFTWVPGTVYVDKMTTAIAASTLPKVIQVHSTEMKNTAVVNSIRSGMFWEIGDLLKDYPNLVKYQDPKLLEGTKYFGKLYGLFYEIDVSRTGVQYRKDWLDKLGLKVPTNLDELYEVMKAFTNNDPDGNGIQDTYGNIDRNELPYGAFKNIATWHGTPNEWGVDEAGKLKPDFMFPEYIDAMKYMKRLYDEKLINQDFTVTTPAQQEEKFLNGKGGMLIGNIFARQEKIAKLNPNGVLDVFHRIAGPKGTFNYGGTGVGSLYLFPKTSVKTEGELKKILAFFNKLLEPDVYKLFNGVEGTHYKKLDDTTIEFLPEAADLRTNEVNPWSNVLHFANFNVYKVKQTDPLIQKQLDAIADNKSIAVMNPAANLLSTTQAEKGTELQKLITDATYKFILGTIDLDGFNKEVDKWRKGGGDKIVEELNQQFKENK
ncbi:MAG: lipoprotein [Paenibacillaceae bacterium]|jgi:putative aldouronate transport system substrate-binding protein|nr:lipoprotein [Paenibacillaceae bacterium]